MNTTKQAKNAIDHGEQQAKELAKIIIQKLSINTNTTFDGEPQKQMIACIATSYIFNELAHLFHQARQEQLTTAQQLMREDTPTELQTCIQELLTTTQNQPEPQPTNKHVPTNWYTKEDTYYG